jgi:hypothetical protein
MDHAAAHERIEDLLLEPARLAGLDASTEPDDLALREHVAGCPTCRADLDGWRALEHRLAEALPGSLGEATAAVEPIELPPSLRSRVAAAIAPAAAERSSVPIEGRPRSRRSIGQSWLALAASLAVLVGAGLITVDQANRRAAAQAEAEALATLVAVVDGVLATEHRIVELRRPDGAAAGSISWSRHDWVVLTSALTRPAAGQQYRCWLEDGSRSVPVGVMDFTGGTAYWVATLDDWQTWEIGPTTQFVVSLEPADAQARTGPIVLSADLRS